MHKSRLERVAVILDALAERNAAFDLGSWVSTTDNMCGTTCCAVGYAALDPELHAQGLWLHVLNHDTYASVAAEDVDDLNTFIAAQEAGSSVGAAPHFDGCNNWRAVRKFFGIEQNDASFLFKSSSYEPGDKSNPRAVSDRIRTFIA